MKSFDRFPWRRLCRRRRGRHIVRIVYDLYLCTLRMYSSRMEGRLDVWF